MERNFAEENLLRQENKRLKRLVSSLRSQLNKVRRESKASSVALLERLESAIREKMSNGPPWTDEDFGRSESANIVMFEARKRGSKR